MGNIIQDEHISSTISTPGEALLKLLADRGMTQHELADRLGMAPKTVNEIVKGKAPLTHDTALALERVLGVTAGFWNRLEAAYQESLARQRDRDRLTEAQAWLQEFPLQAMIARHYLRLCPTPIEQAEELLRLLHVASPVEWRLRMAGIQGYMRRSRRQEGDVNALGVWLQRGENIGRTLSCSSFDATRFQQMLQNLRALTFQMPEVFWPELVRSCQDSGVAVALAPALPGACVCGFTRWLSPQKALVQLSDRYKRADIFWLAFFHAAGHLLKHGKKETFLEWETPEENPKEREADRFAADVILPPPLYKQLIQDKPISRDKILACSEKAGVAPSVIAGRLVQDRQAPEDALSGLLTEIDLTRVSTSIEIEERKPAGTLAELFAGRTGGLHGGGKAWSEDTGKAFAEAMGERHGHNRERTDL